MSASKLPDKPNKGLNYENDENEPDILQSPVICSQKPSMVKPVLSSEKPVLAGKAPVTVDMTGSPLREVNSNNPAKPTSQVNGG